MRQFSKFVAKIQILGRWSQTFERYWHFHTTIVVTLQLRIS